MNSQSIPGWLHALSLVFMGVLLALIVVLVADFITADSDEVFAGVSVVIAAVLAVPLLVAFVLWVVGSFVRRRAPVVALTLVSASAVLGGLGLQTLGVWLLPIVNWS